jgi:hypothetical protein
MATETKMATGGGRISHPLAVRVDRGHPQWPDLSSFFFLFFFVHRKSLRRWAVGSSVCSLEVAVGDGV